MTPILIDSKTISQTTPISLNVHLVTTLNVSAKDAQRQVNCQMVPDLGTGLIAREPELLIAGEQIVWRVPIALSLPKLGELGQVGVITVDAHTGEFLVNAETQERITEHARRLYTGTLQAE